jgi:hypothetical protein
MVVLLPIPVEHPTTLPYDEVPVEGLQGSVRTGQAYQVWTEHVVDTRGLVWETDGCSLRHPIVVARDVDVLDRIEAVNCRLELTVAGVPRELTVETIVPLVGMPYSTVVVTVVVPAPPPSGLGHEPRTVGFRARCTTLPQAERDELAALGHGGRVDVDTPGVCRTSVPRESGVLESSRAVAEWLGEPRTNHTRRATARASFVSSSCAPHTVTLPGADVVDRIEADNCTLELTVGSTELPASASVPLIAVLYQQVRLRMTRINGARPYGYRARLTLLPPELRRQVVDSELEHDGRIYADGLLTDRPCASS